MNKLLMLILLTTIGACGAVKNTSGGIKKMYDTCPPKGERSLKHILCKEPK